MTKYLIYSAFILFSCSQKNEKDIKENFEYKLIDPKDSGEQFLTIKDSVVFYHGKVEIIALDSSESSSTYFLSRAETRGTDHLMFYDFQYSEKCLKISDFDSSKFIPRGTIFSFDIYNSLWGQLKSDTLNLRATKHMYASRSDKIKFIKKKKRAEINKKLMLLTTPKNHKDSHFAKSFKVSKSFLFLK